MLVFVNDQNLKRVIIKFDIINTIYSNPNV